MRISKLPGNEVLAAATGLLQQYVPALTQVDLMEALKTYEAASTDPRTALRPMTRKEAADFLQISLPTVNRYLRDGVLERLKIGKRLVRISAKSINNLIQNSWSE